MILGAVLCQSFAARGTHEPCCSTSLDRQNPRFVAQPAERYEQTMPVHNRGFLDPNLVFHCRSTLVEIKELNALDSNHRDMHQNSLPQNSGPHGNILNSLITISYPTIPFQIVGICMIFPFPVEYGNFARITHQVDHQNQSLPTPFLPRGVHDQK